MSVPSLVTISKNWKEFTHHPPSQQGATLIFGNHSTGKSTLCELIKASVANSRNQNLIFDDTKAVKLYTLPGVIESNVYLIQTVKPSIYNIHPTDPGLSPQTIIDLPTSCLPPMNQAYKKFYSLADSRVAINLLLTSVKKASFILMIEEKATRNTQQLRSILANFIGMCSDESADLPEQFMQSTAIVISKSPDVKIDALLKKFEGCNKKVEDNLTKKINDWLENLKKRNAFYLFKKFTTEAAAFQETKNLYRELSQVNKCDIDMKYFQTLSKAPEEAKREIIKLFESLNEFVASILKALLDIVHGFCVSFQKYAEKKDKIQLQIFGIGKGEKQTKDKGNLPTILQILSICKIFSETHKKITQNQVVDASVFIEILLKNQIIFQSDEIYGVLTEICFLKNKLINSDPNFPQDPPKLSEALSKQQLFKNVQEIVQKISLTFSEEESKEYYQNVKEILNFLMTKSQIEQMQGASKLWIRSSLFISEKQTDKSKALKDLLDLQSFLAKKNENKMLGELFEKIATILVTVGHLPKAISLYYRSCNTQTAIDKMSAYFSNRAQLRTKNIQDFSPYLKLLQEAGLYQESYKVCSLLGSVFRLIEDHRKMQPFLKKKPAGPSEEYINYFTSMKFKELPKEEVQELLQLAESLKTTVQ